MAQESLPGYQAKSNSSNFRTTSLPATLRIEDLSALTGLSVTTIRHYTGNAEKFGHLLPKWFKFRGQRRLVWYEADVLAWMRTAQQDVPKPKRSRGRPTKAEQLARARKG